MKCLFKILFSFFIICFIVINNAKAYTTNGITENSELYYSPSRKIWTNDIKYSDSIILKKKTSHGVGKHSIYLSSKGNVSFFLGSNYEFIKDGRLIAVHNHNFNFYEVIYDDGNFVEIKLENDDVEKIFSDIKILRISDLLQYKVYVRKHQEILLYNDTIADFYGYYFNPKSIQKNDIKGILTIKNQDKIKFLNSDGEAYIIEGR